MAEVAIRRSVVFHPICMADRTYFTCPLVDERSAFTMTQGAAGVSRRWMDLLDTTPMAIQTRVLGLMVDEMAGLAIETGGAHLGRLVASRTVQTRVAMRGVREVSDRG